jgi:hypothetical protein
MTQTIKTAIASVAGILSILVATGALAQDANKPRSTFLELDYVYSSTSIKSPQLNGEGKSTDTYQDGFAVQGSIDLFEQLLLRGSYFDADGGGNDTDLKSGVARVAWLIPTDDAVAIDIGLDYRFDDVKFNSQIDEDISGIGFGFGIRAAPSQNTELGARVSWYQGDFDGTPVVNINFAYNFAEHFGVNVFYDYMDADTSISDLPSYELTQIGLGGRFYF